MPGHLRGLWRILVWGATCLCALMLLVGSLAPATMLEDVCEALGIEWQGSKTLQVIPAAWKGVGNFPTPGGNQDLVTINEPAVYKLGFRSRKPEADRFSTWVAGDVLPSIRKKGYYALPGANVQSDQSLVSELKLATIELNASRKIIALQEELLGVYRSWCAPGAETRATREARTPYRPPLSSAEREEICRLRDEGLGTTEIARRVGCDKSTVRGILKKAGYPPQSPFGGRVSHE